MVERGLAKYAVGQLERGSETGRLHLQYFVQMERSRRLAHMRTVICDRSHWGADVWVGSPSQGLCD